MATCSFGVKERVVYPGQGVGEIIEISEKKFKDDMLIYYVIYFEESDMTVLVPAVKADELGIRTIVSADEAQNALTFLSEKFDPIPSDWKMRYQMNLDLFKKGSISPAPQPIPCPHTKPLSQHQSFIC